MVKGEPVCGSRFSELVDARPRFKAESQKLRIAVADKPTECVVAFHISLNRGSA